MQVPVACSVTITIDLENLFQELGERALRNKSRRTVEIGGRVVADVKEL